MYLLFDKFFIASSLIWFGEPTFDVVRFDSFEKLTSQRVIYKPTRIIRYTVNCAETRTTNDITDDHIMFLSCNFELESLNNTH